MLRNYNYYYLLYKLKHYPTLWIVDESKSKTRLYKKIKNFSSNDETYYIVKKKLDRDEYQENLQKKFKRFKNYEIKKNSNIIFSTK